ncbi:MAG TPA: class I SAM-dependent methyltransferase [Symbiobacteriaceae bacterium]|jgi:SAM-dependent methyltransferase
MGYGEHYHAIAAQMALYRQTNRRMAELAELRPGHAVLDLACGSGLTSLAALAQVPEGLKLYLLDRSPAMIDAARRNVGDRAAAYFTADAGEAAALIPAKLDRVLCNMSLWYFPDPTKVLEQVRLAMKPTGRLLFTLSGTFFNTGGEVVSPQWAFMRALHKQGRVPRAIGDVDRLPNRRSIEGTLASAGFKPFYFEVQEIPSAVPDSEPGGELYNLLRLLPVAELGEPEQSLAALAGLAGEIAAAQPRWRAVHFMAQPTLSPEEALRLSRFAPPSAGNGGQPGVL